jgi:hypothetical protein
MSLMDSPSWRTGAHEHDPAHPVTEPVGDVLGDRSAAAVADEDDVVEVPLFTPGRGGRPCPSGSVQRDRRFLLPALAVSARILHGRAT